MTFWKKSFFDARFHMSARPRERAVVCMRTFLRGASGGPFSFRTMLSLRNSPSPPRMQDCGGGCGGIGLGWFHVQCRVFVEKCV